MRFDVNEGQLESYLKLCSTKAPAYLEALERETWLKVTSPHMLTGFAQGRFLSLISKLLRPNRILEIGTFTGYGTLCLAEGLQTGGKLLTLESNPENAWLAQKYVAISPYSDQIEIQIVKAVEILPKLSETWDLVYIDADKVNNQTYFNLCWPQVSKGGMILIDNVLANGGVWKPEIEQRSFEKAVSQLNKTLLQTAEATVTMLPIRDGLTAVLKN